MERLDVYLTLNNYFTSRNKARNEIKNGNIKVNNKVITKSSYQVDDNSIISIDKNILKYVSRGGLKLEKAINTFNINLSNKVMLDIGSSTGGFSDCALKHNISYIYAVDVGSNQFDKSLLKSNKISLYENTDIRSFPLSNKNISFVTIDVSFISVLKILDVFDNITTLKEVVCLIKPQFECGKKVADKYKGIVLDKNVHNDVLIKVINAFKNKKLYLKALSFSPIKGGSGNIEYLAYFTKEKQDINISYKLVIDEAFSAF